jgi:hypothetical protein
VGPKSKPVAWPGPYCGVFDARVGQGAGSAIIDGEIVVPDTQGCAVSRSLFQRRAWWFQPFVSASIASKRNDPIEGGSYSVLCSRFRGLM